MDTRNSYLLKDTIGFVENIKFSDNFMPKTEIKQEEGFKEENQDQSWKSPPFDVEPKLEQVEASETGQIKIKTEPKEFFSKTCDSRFTEESTFNSQTGIRNSDLLMKTIDFVENIEFSDNVIPKTEIKKEEGFKEENQEIWKSPLFDLDRLQNKLEQVEATETGQTKIRSKPEPKEFFSDDQAKPSTDSESNNVPLKAGHEKNKPFECSLCQCNFSHRGHSIRHIAAVRRMKKIFECSLCKYKSGHRGHLTRHIATVHEKKKPFECSLCPCKFGEKRNLTAHITFVHEKKKRESLHELFYRRKQR